MKNYIFGYIILNYNSFNDTVLCIESIQKLNNYNNCKIVIVDNNSTDDSKNLLMNKYTNIENIYIIINDENLGFSKGNNVGIKFAKEKLKCDFIIMTNSDTVMLQNDMCERIVKSYKAGHYAIIGPEINNPGGKKQLPVSPNFNIKTLKREKIKLTIHYVINKIFLDKIYSNLIELIKKNNKVNLVYKRQEDVILHGSCIIFTPKYFECRLIGIPEVTKFYYEEHVIYLYAKKNNLKILYDPSIKILHTINGSTNNTYKNNRKKNNFKYKNRIQSVTNVIKYYNSL